MLTFNELTGEEVSHILRKRCAQVMAQVPYLQRHLTLPRVRMTLNVKLELWADQPLPEVHTISDTVEVISGSPPPRTLAEVFEAESVDSSAPIPGGLPPDEIREMHGLPIAQAGPGPREVGGHITTSDHYAHDAGLEGREVEGLPGLKVSRTGSGQIDGLATSAHSTVAKIDQGPAGLRSGNMQRDRWQFGRGSRA